MGSFYGRVRGTAYELWRGPNYLKHQGEIQFRGGYCVLRLALRKRTSGDPQIEARAVYASVADETQPDAIVRAMSWDSTTVVRKSRDDPPENTPFTIPAKFVPLPIAHMWQWVKAFAGLQTALQVFPLADDGLPICSLRIETDYVSNAFEKVWQVLPGEQDELTRVWQEIWHEMGNALQSSPTITGIEETFPCIEGNPEAYDLQAYRPTLTLP